MLFAQICDAIQDKPASRTYAAAGHALLSQMRERGEIDAGAHAD